MTGVTIIIPVYNTLEDARACVASIYASRTELEFDIVIVNNGSRPDITLWLTEQEFQHRNLTALHFKDPLGFARAINEGVKIVSRDFLVLLNSDTLVTDHWLDHLSAALIADPALGIVSPVTNACGHAPQQDPAARDLSPTDAQAYAQQIQHRTTLTPEPQRLVFFCVMLRRALWLQLNGIDEIYGPGNFEDDDFCLHTRLAGYTMAVLPNAFVFHSQSRTFAANKLDHTALLAENQAIFGARARAASTALRQNLAPNSQASQISVLVPVTNARVYGLRDTLASLANQTIQGFQTILATPYGLDLSSQLAAFPYLHIEIIHGTSDTVAALLNAATLAASRTVLAYLPAADIAYPFHLEVLLSALCTSNATVVHSAWSVSLNLNNAERRDRVQFHDASPGLDLGDWSPLLCWMHRRDPSANIFDFTCGTFAPWAFIIDELLPLHPVYLNRVTCERTPNRPGDADFMNATRVMLRFPAGSPWQQLQRKMFLEGVARGYWEQHLILLHNERARRARKLLGNNTSLRPNLAHLAQLKQRLNSYVPANGSASHDPDKPAIVFFNIIPWSALTQRPQHFAARLAARGHLILWVDTHLRAPSEVDPATLIEPIVPGVIQVNLPALPGDIYTLRWHPRIVDAMLACFYYLRASFQICSAIQLVNFPRWEPIVSTLKETFNWPIIYDCLDDQPAFADLFGHTLGDSETTLTRDSSVVIASSQTLLDRITPHRPDVLLIPNAADYLLFRDAAPSLAFSHLSRPIIGFFGALADWLDFSWIAEAASRFPTWSFIFIGPESFASNASRRRWSHLTNHSNIHVFPQTPPSLLAQYLAAFDVAIMPFQDTYATRAMNAVKLYEYLAAGKPVVAIDLPETQPFAEAGLIATYRTHEESFGLLEAAIQQGNDPARAVARQAFAARNDWSHRIDTLSSALARATALKPRPTAGVG
jgi:GT2 family glycosyltransferase/glycosyltransferase involved in cell wall biosynthesis